MGLFFTSDHHFGHKNIIEYGKRPFKDLDEMHRELKARWNSIVTNEDTVFYVGDFSFMKPDSTRKVLESLNCKELILVKGNHDKNLTKLEDCFDRIVDRITLRILGEYVMVSHYPYKSTPEEIEHAKQNGYEIRYLERRLEDQGHWLIHGHLHNNGPKVRRRMINVSVEQWDYYPVSEDRIIEIMENPDAFRTDSVSQSDH